MIDNTGLNQVFPIYNQDGTPFYNIVLHKTTVDSIVMSLGDKIVGDAYYISNNLNVTMQEYIVYNGVKYILVNPPTIVREGLVVNNSELKGMTKYSFEFYHPMYQLSNIPFCDVAVSTDQQRYLSESKTFSWIGKPQDLINKLNKNLQGTQWIVEKSPVFPQDKEKELSDVITFDKNMISEVLKTFYDTWGIPYIIDVVDTSESSYEQGKRFKVVCGYPSNEIYVSEEAKQQNIPYVFQMGKGVGLKNNSRTPRNNKIITRISGYGSEDNIPYGYPQIVWNGDEEDPRLQYPLYDGIVGGRYVKLIQHPFTRNHLMPSVYSDAVNKKVNPNATGYNPNIELKDYYDAIGSDYPNNINPLAPSYEIHEFEDIKPEMNDGTSNVEILDATPLNVDLTPTNVWVDDIDDDGNFVQSYFLITLPQLAFDIYACAAITQEMKINMRSGACIGCTFPIQVDWDDYKRNFYDENGDFAPDGEQRDLTKYPKSNLDSIDVIVQKENSTFGTIMPSRYQQPQTGDEFVVLGISLPEEYITLAEQKLDSKMREYLLKNNVYYFDYPLKFDEYFLSSNVYVLSQLKPNSIVRFNFAGTELSLYVKQITKKFGNSPLPEYNITLTDNIEVALNQIGQTVEVVSNLSGEFDFMQKNVQTIQGNVEKESKRKNINRFYYYAQEWDDNDEIVYVVNQLQAPYFSYQDEYWIFNPVKIGTYSMHEMGEPTESINNILGWEKMNAEFKYIITKVIFSENAYLGSFIINGDWMISQHGTINGQESTNYTQFDPDHPNDNTGVNFIPHYAVNGLTGETYQNKSHVRGEIRATSGIVGGFSIGTNELKNTNYNASVNIQNAASSPTQIAKIGKDATDAMTGLSCSLQAESTKSGTYNTALYLKASGATYNYAFHGEGNGVLNGLMFGFKTKFLSVAGSGDKLYQIDLNEGSTIVLKGSHSSGNVAIAMPKLSNVRQCLGLPSNSSTAFAIEINIINLSAYGELYLSFRGDTHAGTTLGSDYPYWMSPDDTVWGTYVALAKGDYMKYMLIYSEVAGSSSMEYRAYLLIERT